MPSAFGPPHCVLRPHMLALYVQHRMILRIALAGLLAHLQAGCIPFTSTDMPEIRGVIHTSDDSLLPSQIGISTQAHLDACTQPAASTSVDATGRFLVKRDRSLRFYWVLSGTMDCFYDMSICLIDDQTKADFGSFFGCGDLPDRINLKCTYSSTRLECEDV